jgi:hypothetical protein
VPIFAMLKIVIEKYIRSRAESRLHSDELNEEAVQ